MAILLKELIPMRVGESKEIILPLENGVVLHIQKLERDVYTGHISGELKTLAEFQYRSIPGVGLVIMSTFELCEVESIKPDNMSEDLNLRVQKLIDDRLSLHSLIGQVVDKKILERDAIEKLVLLKITQLFAPQLAEEAISVENIEPKEKVSDKLKKFLDLKKKQKSNDFSIYMAKGESFSCPDCAKEIFANNEYNGCICMGENQDSKVFIKKASNGINIRFSKSWDKENIEMLLDILRKKHNE